MDTGGRRHLAEALGLTAGGKLTEATARIQQALRGKVGPGLEAVGALPNLLRGVVERTRPDNTPREVPADADGRFQHGSFSNAAGTRAYKLFVPKGYSGRGALVVMLHGCTQSPDDFAAGTRMNVVAGAQECLVLYPAQAASANHSKCWNWFAAADQSRDAGEPSIVADMTRKVMAEHAIDPSRVFVAGLSAGGAAAAVLGAAYPDLYAAVGVHSGLACGAARDLPSAMAAMQKGHAGSAVRRPVPTIVFHGDRDRTVNPANGDAVASQMKPMLANAPRVRQGEVPGGHRYTVTQQEDARGRVVLEKWVVHGAGHAWAGGCKAGSYTDPQGPDASREMLRFFLAVV